MKAILIALSFSTLSFAAAASEATVLDDHFMSTRTRAEVRAEVADALARGDVLSHGEAGGHDFWRGAPSTKTRTQVTAELAEARTRGLLPPVGEA
jgi:hypothetical protein